MKKNIPFLVILLCSAFIMDVQAGNGKKSYAARRNPRPTFNSTVQKVTEPQTAGAATEIKISDANSSISEKEESIRKASKELADKAITAALVVQSMPEPIPHTPITYTQEEEQIGANIANLFDDSSDTTPLAEKEDELSPAEAFAQSQVLKAKRQKIETERSAINNLRKNIDRDIYMKETYELGALPKTTLKDLQRAEEDYQLALLTYRDMQKVRNAQPSHLADTKKAFIDAQDKRNKKQEEFTAYNMKELEINRLACEKRKLRTQENELIKELNKRRRERKEYKEKHDLYTTWSFAKQFLIIDEDARVSDLELDTDDEEAELPVFDPVNQITQSK